MKIVFITLLMLVIHLAHGKDTDDRRVLLINSYHPQYAWTDQLTKGVVEALSTSIAPENIHVEYMDSRRFVDDDVYSQTIRNLLLYKYQQYKPDVIITSDDHAFNFMLKTGDQLFPNKPVVFNGVNVFNPQSIEGKSNFIGIPEGMEILGNLKLITRLQPNVKRIIMLGDTTGLGLRMVRRAREIQLQWTQESYSDVKLEIWDRFSLDDLYRRVSNLPSDTAILMLAIHMDSTGQYFSFDKELPILTDRSSVPIYGMWGALMIGNGVAGGMMNDPKLHGGNAANLALALLSGVPISEVKAPAKAKYIPVFDYNVLKRFGISLDNLPANSQVHFKPVSVYEMYTKEINSIIAFVVILLIIIKLLLINIHKRSQIQKQLDQLNQNLEVKVKSRTEDLNQRNNELELARKRMEEMAHTDPLTGLGNRRAGQDDLQGFVDRALRDGQPLAVALVDVDFFKRINDQYGHDVGDDVLVGLGQILKNVIRPSDRVYRWGGEEFLIVLPQTNMQFAGAVCNRLVNALHDNSFDHAGIVTASIGAVSLGPNEQVDSLLKRADELLYKAKDNGRDQVMQELPMK